MGTLVYLNFVIGLCVSLCVMQIVGKKNIRNKQKAVAHLTTDIYNLLPNIWRCFSLISQCFVYLTVIFSNFQFQLSSLGHPA